MLRSTPTTSIVRLYQAEVIYARIEWLEMEGKSEETKCEMERADKRKNHFRFDGDALLTGLREWDKQIKVSESYLEAGGYGASGFASLPVVRDV